MMCNNNAGSSNSLFCDNYACSSDTDCASGSCVNKICITCNNNANSGSSLFCDGTICVGDSDCASNTC